MRLTRLAVATCLVMCLCHACWAAEEQSGSTSLAVSGGGLSLRLSDDGRMVGERWAKRVARPITVETVLAGCQRDGDVAVRRLASGGVEFTRHLMHTADGNRCVLTDRLAADWHTASAGRSKSAAKAGPGPPQSRPAAISRHAEHPILDRLVRFGPGRARRDLRRQRHGAGGRLRRDTGLPLSRLDRSAASDAAAEHEVSITEPPTSAPPIRTSASLPRAPICSPSPWRPSSSRRTTRG